MAKGLVSPLFYQDAQNFYFPAPLSCLGVRLIRESGGMAGAKLSRYVDSIGEEWFFILCARLRPANKWVKEYPSRGGLLVRTLLRPTPAVHGDEQIKMWKSGRELEDQSCPN